MSDKRKALDDIAHLGTDCSPADDPESFYKSQLQKAIGIAARAIAPAKPDYPRCPHCERPGR
jgi:hypothetical protein